MKNTFKVLGIIALFAVIGFSMVACGDNSGSGGENKINPFVGTWIKDGSGGSVKITVTDSAWTAYYNSNIYCAGTYIYSESTATFTVTNKGMSSQNVGTTGNVTIQSNGKMVITSFTDTAANGTYTKQEG